MAQGGGGGGGGGNGVKKNDDDEERKSSHSLRESLRLLETYRSLNAPVRGRMHKFRK